jgi:hypothetical protein
MSLLRIKNWCKYQHYKERNPPWIKLHRELLTSETWVMLADASRVLAIALMLLASDNDNKFEDTEQFKRYVKRVAYLEELPNFSPLINCGFLEKVLADASDCKQDSTNARPETETETETETEKDQIPSTNVTGIVGESQKTSPHKTILQKDDLQAENKIDSCPHKKIIELYHGILPEGTRIEHWTEARAKNLKSRWNDKKPHQNLAFWERFFNLIRASSFLMGKTCSPGRAPYRVSLDSIIAPKMFYGIVEFKYHSREEKDEFMKMNER